MNGDGKRRLPKRLVRVLNEMLGYDPDYPESIQEWENIHSLIGCWPLEIFVKTHSRDTFVELGASLGTGEPVNQLLERWPGGAEVDFLAPSEDGEEPESPYFDGTECLDFLVTPISEKTGKPQKTKRFYIRVFPSSKE